jgi:hypothetical protein
MGSTSVFDTSERTDGALSRSDFSFDPERNLCSAPPAESRRNTIAFSKPRGAIGVSVAATDGLSDGKELSEVGSAIENVCERPSPQAVKKVVFEQNAHRRLPPALRPVAIEIAASSRCESSPTRVAKRVY